MRKAVLITLVVVNVLLAAMLAGTVFRPKSALAQSVGLSGNFFMVAGKVLGSRSDVVYVVDLETRELIALQFDRPTSRLSIKSRRDLARDLAYATPARSTDRKKDIRRGTRKRR